MKFTAIAVASAALVGSAVSAAPVLDYSCTTPVHYHNASLIAPDIPRAMGRWQNSVVLPNGSEDVYEGSIVNISCRANDDSPSDVTKMHCRSAIFMLWVYVQGNSTWNDNGFVPESCWIHWTVNSTAIVKWQSK